jgi:hypothetical protein
MGEATGGGGRVQVETGALAQGGRQFQLQGSALEEQVLAPLQATEAAQGADWAGLARAQYLRLHEQLVGAVRHVGAQVQGLGRTLGHSAGAYGVLSQTRFGPEAGGLPVETERAAGARYEMPGWVRELQREGVPVQGGHGQYTVDLSEFARGAPQPTVGDVVVPLPEGLTYRVHDDREAEYALEEWLGTRRNAEPRIAFLLPSGTTVAPDFLKDGIHDAKFVGILDVSDQLRGFAELARALDLPLNIYVRTDTVVRSGIIDLVRGTGGNIYRAFTAAP